jgi:hypothetical protein
VKVYLVSGKKCIAKAKTNAARKTLDPLYQQILPFREPFQGCILQVSVKRIKIEIHDYVEMKQEEGELTKTMCLF